MLKMWMLSWVVENVDVIVGVKRPKWVFDLLSWVVGKMDVVVGC